MCLNLSKSIQQIRMTVILHSGRIIKIFGTSNDDSFVNSYCRCTSFDVHNVDIVDFAMSTMLNRYRVYIVDIADIALTMTSSKS